MAAKEKYVRQRVVELRLAQTAGNEMAALEAFLLCAQMSQPVPEWVAKQVAILTAHALTGTNYKIERGRSATPYKRHTQDTIDYARYDMVREIFDIRKGLLNSKGRSLDHYERSLQHRIGTNREAAFNAVSEQLARERSFARGSADAVRKSYERVSADLSKKRKHMKYHLTDQADRLAELIIRAAPPSNR